MSKYVYAIVLSLVISVAGASISFSQNPSQSDLNHSSSLQLEFIRFNPDYVKMKADRLARTLSLLGKVREREAAGLSTDCSHQILWEIKALITQSADFKLLDQRLDKLENLLANPIDEKIALNQDSLTGSWGRCFEEWYCKLDAFSDEIGKDENKGKPLKFQPHFLDLVNSPEKLTSYLNSISVSDIPGTGRDNLLEFNLSTTNLLRLIMRDRPEGYSWNPELKNTIKNLVFNHFRNPETGWWGESYVRNGKVEFVDDLSMTFHIVTYLHGEVPNMSLINKTLLAVKDLNFPVGWLWKGEYWNHNNMDVVAIFKAGWSNASKEQKRAISVEIQKMLDWCLNQSLLPDGSFKPNVADGSLEEGVYYGTSFLGRIGYFDKSERFWTEKEFPEAEAIRKKIVNYILMHLKTGGSGGSYYESALHDYLKYNPKN
jgi:hypothetical protein